MREDTEFNAIFDLLRYKILDSMRSDLPQTSADPTEETSSSMSLDVYLFFLSMSMLDLTGVTYALARYVLLRAPRADDQPTTVERIADFYSKTEVGKELHRRGLDEGLERGLDRYTSALDTAVRDRFGDQTEVAEIAKRLAQSPDPVAAVHAITQAATFQDLIDVSNQSQVALAT
jgi:hypothetical protein